MISRGLRSADSYILVKHCSTFEINVLVIGVLFISGACAWVVQDTIGQFSFELNVDLPFLPQTKYAKSLLDFRLGSTISMFWNGGAKVLALLMGFGSGSVLPVVCLLLWASLLLPLSYNKRKQLLILVRHLGKWQTCLMFTLMLLNEGVSFDKTLRPTPDQGKPDFGHLETHMGIVSMGGCINGLYVLGLLVLFNAAIENVNERSFYKTTRSLLPRVIIPSTRARVMVVVFATIGLLVTLMMYFAGDFFGPFVSFDQTGVLANIESETMRHSKLTFAEAMDISSPKEPSRTYFLVGIFIAPVAEGLLLIMRATTNKDSRLYLLFYTLISSFNLLDVFIGTLIAVVANIDDVTKFLVTNQSQGICPKLKIHYHEYCFQCKAQWRSSALMVITACVCFFSARCILWMTAKSAAPKTHSEGLTRGLINSTHRRHNSSGSVECNGLEGERSQRPKLTPFGSDEGMKYYTGADEEEGVYQYLHHLLIPGEVEVPLSPSASPNFVPEIANIMSISPSSGSRT